VFFVVDLDGKVLFDNGGMPLTKGKSVGKNIAELDAKHAKEWKAHNKTVAQKGEAMVFQEQNTVNGKEHDVMTMRFPVFGQDGMVCAVGGTARFC
jgi:hypothetical protein